MILVVGASGTNGREVVLRLSYAGKRVRALVRNPDKVTGLNLRGVELVKGDLDNAASVSAALQGIQSAFIVTAVDERAAKWFATFFDAAKKAGVRHIVKFSAMGAGDSGSELLVQHGKTDEWLKETGIPYTILRPNSFYQNMLWSAGTIKDHGAFYLPMGNAAQSLVDVRDIADVATKVLSESGHEGKAYEITGPQLLTYHDIASTLSAVLGKPVKYVPVSPEAALESMLKSGMPPWNARSVTDLLTVFTGDKYAYTTDAVKQITGRSPAAFEQFARDNAAAFSN